MRLLTAADTRLRRSTTWDGIIIHHTGIPTDSPKDQSAWARFSETIAAWLTKKDENYVSAHYVINRDGSVIQLVDPMFRESFHAGVSSHWNPRTRSVVDDWNKHAIGIELVGDGNRLEYSPEQYRALADLCRDLMARFPSIHPQAILGHEQIAPGRKTDPGKLFDWGLFRRLLHA